MKETIDTLREIVNKKDEFFKKYKKEIPFVLYGCGLGGEQAYDFLHQYGIVPKGICDTDIKKHGLLFHGLVVSSLEKVISQYEDVFFYISAPTHIGEIAEMLRERISVDRIIYFPEFNQQEKFIKHIELNFETYVEIYDSLVDEYSKKTMLNIIKGWLSCDYHFFEEVNTNIQYFDKDILNLSQNEVFLDVGAFDGDTVICFIEAVNNHYKKVYAMEPHPKLFGRLTDTIKDKKNIVPINKGAYSCKQDIGLHINHNMDLSSAYITNDVISELCVQVDRIDDIIVDQVTFIKLDIEGAELEALKGAKNLITQNLPKMAVCVYHRYQDLYEIYKFISNLNVGYKFKLRHHSDYTGETVLYCFI